MDSKVGGQPPAATGSDKNVRSSSPMASEEDTVHRTYFGSEVSAVSDGTTVSFSKQIGGQSNHHLVLPMLYQRQTSIDEGQDNVTGSDEYVVTKSPTTPTKPPLGEGMLEVAGAVTVDSEHSRTPEPDLQESASAPEESTKVNTEENKEE